MSLATSQDLFDEIDGDTNTFFFLLYTEMYQFLEDVYNSMDQLFLSDQCMVLQNHDVGERSI